MPVVAAPHQLPLTSWTSNMTLYVLEVFTSMLVGQDSHVHLTARGDEVLAALIP